MIAASWWQITKEMVQKCFVKPGLKGGLAKYVLVGNIILLATVFPMGKREEAFVERVWGSLLHVT